MPWVAVEGSLIFRLLSNWKWKKRLWQGPFPIKNIQRLINALSNISKKYFWLWHCHQGLSWFFLRRPILYYITLPAQYSQSGTVTVSSQPRKKDRWLYCFYVFERETARSSEWYMDSIISGPFPYGTCFWQPPPPFLLPATLKQIRKQDTKPKSFYEALL